MELNEELIAKAQNGDEIARTKLIHTLNDNGAMKQLSKYLYLNRLLEPDDVRAEFWFGVAKAIPQVKSEIGNPIQYLIKRGIWQVRSALRQAISKDVFYRCPECGTVAPLRRTTDKMECRKCGSEDLMTWERKATSIIPHKPVEVHKTITIDIDGFKMTLTVQEKRVFELIEQGIDRDNSNNYLREIGDALKVSPQCVTIYLRKIRTKLREHMEEMKGRNL